MEVDSAQDAYFSSYEDLEIHRLMLEDHPRTQTYRDAIMSNKDYFKDKIVMDVGCGTGILSIFCAQAGAKKVYAVEASKVANIAIEIVKENNLEEVIEVIECQVEDLDLPEDIKVDVIISEWMGFYLLHEGMLDSVLIARDLFLKDDGAMFPQTASILVAPCSVPSLYKSWDNIYGVSMKKFATLLRASKYNKPEILTVKPEDLLAEPVVLAWIDLNDVTIEELVCFSIKHVQATSKAGLYQGICVWFDCTFPHQNGQDNLTVTLSTGPESVATHWKQTVIVLPQEQSVEELEPIAFQLDMNRDTNNCRRYNLQLTMLDPQEVEHPIPCSCDMTKCILIKTYMEQHNELNKGDIPVQNTGNVLVEDKIDDDDDEE